MSAAAEWADHRVPAVSACLRAAVALVAMAAPSAAQPPGVVVPQVSTPPVLAAFTVAEPPPAPGLVSGFLQREPQDGVPATLGTRVYVSYDRQRLYVIFVCRDNPRDIRARITRREASEADDSVSVYLDTFRDRRRAYVFSSNPLGVQSERIKTEGQDDDESFETLWHTEAALTSFGYVVKMAIPFRSLRFSSAETQSWGIAFSRHVQRLNEESYWPLVSKRAQGFVPQFAAASGLEHISPGANVQVTPYGAFTGGREGAGSDGVVDTAGRFGLDAKVGLGSAFVIDAALNPDFSEVETDAPQVTVNERFEVLFPERRSFFVENAGYFNMPVPVFFSRRILDPLGGVKVTGKAGPWVTAGLVAQDRTTPDRDGATAMVAALRREFGRSAHVGALVTSRDGGSESNHVVSLDGRWTLGKTWAVAGQVTRTRQQTSSERPVGGTGLFAEIAHDSRHLDVTVQFTDLTPEFDAALGFIRRVDMRQLEHDVSYVWRPSRGPLVKYGPTLDGFVVWDHNRALTDWRWRPRFEMEFVGQTKLLVDHARSFELLAGLAFNKQRSTFEFETERSRWWAFKAGYEIGTDVNRRPPAGQLPHLVDRRAFEVEASVRPGRRLAVSATYLQTTLLRQGADRSDRHVLDNHILRSTAYLHLSRALSLRAILDYERVSPDPAFSAVRQKQPVGIDLLGSYQLNPGTAIFVGYVDRLEPAGQALSLPLLPVLESVGRQAFVKVSWLFRY